MMFRNKLDYFLIIGFIFLPIILHLNEINLNQYELLTINYLILFQIIISLIVFSLSLMIYLIFKKNFLSEIKACFKISPYPHRISLLGRVFKKFMSLITNLG